MKTLKTLTLLFTSMCILAVTAFAGETNSPPCTPGQTEAPPCVSQSVSNDSTEPGETSGPPAPDTGDMVNIVEAVQLALSLL